MDLDVPKELRIFSYTVSVALPIRAKAVLQTLLAIDGLDITVRGFWSVTRQWDACRQD